ncbi:YIP1 family protein [Dehalobacter sp. DCM]|uniref:Yip1 family protein n=1 Tax=Dehalobacter sp. DCM TaxID=2907827 RepID=UPI003081B0A5|nr:YIP1 family protein [Dehalobacter sp. DCM]
MDDLDLKETRDDNNMETGNETGDAVKMSLGEKCIKVITSPRKAFTAIAQDPRFLWLALILIVITVLSVLAIIPETKAMTEKVLLQSGSTPDQIAMSMNIIMIGAVVGGALALPVTWLIQAAILALYNHLSLGEARFKQLFAVAVFSGIPGTILGIITTVLIKTLGYESAMKVTTSLAIFMGTADTTNFLYRVLQRIELFSIWGIILFILGGAIAMKKKPRGLAIYIGVIWIVFVVISTLVGGRAAV